MNNEPTKNKLAALLEQMGEGDDDLLIDGFQVNDPDEVIQ